MLAINDADPEPDLLCAAALQDEAEGLGDEMQWTAPQYTRGQVDAAGDALIRPAINEQERDNALAVINNWRASHSYPLQCLKMTLRGRAKSVDSSAVVAQRLKRLSSIESKLRLNEGMKLSRMHDIGGCRAVLTTVQQVDAVLERYEEGRAKNPTSRSEFVRTYDYITTPKLDGYRGVHYVYKYRTSAEKLTAYNGLRIELQIRTQLQHAWATAVETVSTFTGQALKSALKSKVGDAQWKRFFALMGSAIAEREGRPPVPGTPGGATLAKELRDISISLKIEHALYGWRAAINDLTEARETDWQSAASFLLTLDSNTRIVTVWGFKKSEQQQAAATYAQVERESEDKPEIQAVLVSADSLHALRSAYPNYFLDTTAFVEALKLAIKPVRRYTHRRSAT